MVSCCARPTSAGQRARAGRPAQRAAPFVECHALQPDRQLGLLLCCALLQLALAHTAAAAGGCRWGCCAGSKCSALCCCGTRCSGRQRKSRRGLAMRSAFKTPQAEQNTPSQAPAGKARAPGPRQAVPPQGTRCLRAPSGIARKAEGDPPRLISKFFQEENMFEWLRAARRRPAAPATHPIPMTPFGCLHSKCT